MQVQTCGRFIYIIRIDTMLTEKIYIYNWNYILRFDNVFK